jgi:uncharacterized protein (TIGR02453 family)
MDFLQFEPTIFQFLEDLAANNNRRWFQENKFRYESEVLAPCQAFIRDFGPRLKKISPYFQASDRRVGGSLMRVYRDTRFSKDKTPYKTNVGIQFRHEMGQDVHAPGFYVHIAPDACFLGAGVWRPDSGSLRKIRTAIVQRESRWSRACRSKRFREHFTLAGESLKRAPRGFPEDHPRIEDLKRTDFIALRDLKATDVTQPRFAEQVADSFAASKPFVRFLCEALLVPF